MKNQKGFASIVLIVSMVILLGVVGYFVWQAKLTEPVVNQAVESTTPQIDTSNWKTYKNTKYGYEFKYPGDWTAEESPKLSYKWVFGIEKLGPTECGEGDACDYAKLTVFKGSEAEIDNFNEKYGDDYNDRTEEFLGFKVIIDIDTDNNGNVYSESIEAIHQLNDGKSLSIFWSRGNYENANDFSYRKYLLPMLSTFKFTEPVKVDPVIQPFSECFPTMIDIYDLPFVASIKQKLTTLKAECNDGVLVDSSKKEIIVYHLGGCWKTQPPNYKDFMQKQQESISKLEAKYTVLKISCTLPRYLVD